MNIFRVDIKNKLSLAIILGVLFLSGIISYRFAMMRAVVGSEQVQFFLLAIVLLILAIIAFRNMQLALTMMILSSVVVNYSIDTGTESSVVLAVVWVILLIAVWAVRMLIFDRHIQLLPSNMNIPWIALMVTLVVSWIASYTITSWDVHLPRNILVVQAGQVALFGLSAAAFWLFANHAVSDKTLKIWTAAIIGFGFVSFAFEAFLRKDFYASGMTGAMLMWPVVLLTSQLIFNPKLDRRLRLAGYASLAVWGVWVVRWSFTFKGGWMPAALGIGILVFLKNARLGIVLGLLGGSYLLWSNFGQAFFSGEEASLYRPLIWLDVLRMGLRSPILGLGPVVYMFHWADPRFESLTFQTSQTYAWNRFNFSPPSHNLFVDIFAQTGIVGTIFFVWLIAAAAVFGWRMYKCYKPGFHSAYTNGVYAGFAAIAISSAPFADWLIPFVYNIGLEGFAHSVYSWILLGTLVALDHRMKDCPEDARY